MPKYRYWLLVDGEDEDNDSTVQAEDTASAAEYAAAEIYEDGDGPPKSGSMELGIRMVGANGFPEGPAEMFEVYIDWSPSYTACHRGTQPQT